MSLERLTRRKSSGAERTRSSSSWLEYSAVCLSTAAGLWSFSSPARAASRTAGARRCKTSSFTPAEPTSVPRHTSAYHLPASPLSLAMRVQVWRLTGSAVCIFESAWRVDDGADASSSTEPFSSCICLADLQNVDGLGELAGAPRAASQLAEDPPGLELGV